MSEDQWPIDQAAIEDAVAWLITARRFDGPRKVLAELCTRLADAGSGLYRASAFVRTLHPSIMGRRYTWTAGGEVTMFEAPYAVLESDLFKMSPVGDVYKTARPLRLRLCEPGFQSHYNNIDELRGEGASDYVIQPLFFTNGEIHAISWTTRRPGGFNAHELAAFDAVAPPFTRATEIYCLRRTAVTLLDTYVGHGAGARILSGNIKRGDAQEIKAVILAADLRGFTHYTASHDGAQVVERLNAFFDILVAPIAARR
jgi:adenylate cyclase